MQSRDPRESGEYWKKHVMSWEAGAYYRDAGGQPRFWDGLAALFRGNGMYVRMHAALRLAAPHIQGMVVLDIGCASGRFALQLVEAGARRVIGLDISPDAIEAANQRRLRSPYADRLEFRVADLTESSIELPQVDLLTALGVIEYFEAPALDRLLSKFRTRYFLLDFPDAEGRRRAWIIWNLRQVYLRVHRCPGVFLFTQEQFRGMAAAHGFQDLRYVRHSIFDYITNLPAVRA